MAVALTMFLASLIGIPPLGGWYAKFGVFSVLIEAETPLGLVTAIVMAVNTAIAAYYYLKVAKAMWFDDAPDGDVAPVAVPASLTAAVVLSLVVTFVLGILPGLITDVTEYGPIAIGGR
jgi:NADH-quinone oxidoreductase subunit N